MYSSCLEWEIKDEEVKYVMTKWAKDVRHNTQGKILEECFKINGLYLI